MKRRSNWARKARVPVISPAAVDAYLNHPRNSYDFLKDVPKAELADHAYKLGHRFAVDPWHHQLVCFAIGAQLDSFLYFLKMGGGKSSIALNLMRYRKRRQELQRALVLVPEILHVDSWEDQIKEHAPDLNYRLVYGTGQEKADELERPSDLCVMNYAGLMTFATDRFKVRKKQGGTVNKELIIPKAASEFASRFNFVVYDEPHRVTDDKSLYFDLFRWIAAAAKFRYVLDGTPHGRDPTPLFHYFKMVDGGETFGPHVGMFRQALFTAKKDYWAGLKWTFDTDKTEDLHRIIKNRSISYGAQEYGDMPRCLRIGIPVHLTDEGQLYYQRIVQGVKEARGDYRSMEGLYTRMRQCASGFLAMRADDERIEVQFRKNPKMDRLHEFLLSRPDEKIIVFHEFIHSGNMIERMLQQAKIPYAAMNGRTKDIGTEYRRLLNDKNCRIGVLNNTVGSEAINPHHVCRRAVFYESPDDSKRREQAEMRVWRPGQKYTTYIHDLLVRGTIEAKIARYNQEGKSLLAAVMHGTEELE